MKAARLHAYHESLKLEEVDALLAEPAAELRQSPTYATCGYCSGK